MEEEGDPNDPVVEAALDQALGNRKCGLGGLLTDYPTLKYANPDDEQDLDCDVLICKCYVHQDCVKGGPSVRTRLSASLDIGNEPSSCRTSAVLLLVLTLATPQLWSQRRLMLATNRS